MKHGRGTNCRGKGVTVTLLSVALVLFVLGGWYGSTRDTANTCASTASRAFDVMIDAGSTGSRIYVYEFIRRNQAPPELRSEFVKRVRPGLSSFAAHLDEAAASLQTLLQSALAAIPVRYHRCTAITLKATAGLRLLPEPAQVALLSIANASLAQTPLLSRGASVISGREEGIYGWLAVNYLLRRLTSPATSVVMVDMGGGSAQVVFETDTQAGQWLPFDYATHLRLGPRRATLYHHSYLGLGLNEAKRAVREAATRGADLSACFLTNTSGLSSSSTATNMSSHGSRQLPAFETCRAIVEQVVLNRSECAHRSCGMHGVPQPELAMTTRDVYAFSFFHDLIVRVMASDAVVRVSSFRSIGTRVCAEMGTIGSTAHPPDACIEYAYLYAFLRYGLGLPDEKELHVDHEIDKKAVAWSLGASLASLLQLDI